MIVGGQVAFGQPCLLLTIGSFILLTQPIYGLENCIDSRPDNATGRCENGCKFGFYGLHCNKSCSQNCHAACGQRTGNCLTGCDDKWFKLNCSRNCIGYCKYDVCDIKSGECIHGCIDGYYGPSCDQKCSENCTGGVCDEFGGCRCKKGVEDTACYLDCTDNCVDGQCDVDASGQPTCSRGCLPGRTGHFCQEWCPSNCSKCDSTGICIEANMERRLVKRDLANSCCTDGRTGNGCNIKCPNCIYNRSCTLFCVGGSFGDECHLNCSNSCSKGTNGRPGCVKDTGKCHSGCLQGFYGFTCRKECSLNCRGRRCFQGNGNCVECEPLKYGPKCEDECGHCIDKQCGRNGTCRTCEHGWYGLRCQDKCTDNCKTKNCRVDIRGNHVCVGDCVEGYTGDGCSEKCPSGCPKFCLRKSGTCPERIGEVINGKSDGLMIGLIIGLVVTVCIAAVGLTIFLILWKKGKISCQCKRRKEKENPDESKALSSEKQQSGVPPEVGSPQNLGIVLRVKRPDESPQHQGVESKVERRDESPQHLDVESKVERPDESPQHQGAESKVERRDESPQHLGVELKVERPDESPQHLGDSKIIDMHAASKLCPPLSRPRESSVTADWVALDKKDIMEILEDFGKSPEGESHKRKFWSNLGYSEENIQKSSDVDSVYTMLEKAPALYGQEAEQVNYKIILALRFSNMVDIADHLITKYEDCLPSQFVDVNRDVKKLKVGHSGPNENISVQGPKHQAVQKETKTGGLLQDEAPFSAKSDDEPVDVHKEEEAPLLK